MQKPSSTEIYTSNRTKYCKNTIQEVEKNTKVKKKSIQI